MLLSILTYLAEPIKLIIGARCARPLIRVVIVFNAGTVINKPNARFSLQPICVRGNILSGTAPKKQTRIYFP